MKLLIRRDQRDGMLGVGKPVFSLEVRAQISDEERAAIAKYRLGDTVLYEKNTIVDPGSGLLGLASRAVFKALNTSVSVKDLAAGKKIECKSIIEMLDVEAEIKEVGRIFQAVLHAAMHFGGDEVVDLAA